ncbi:hypothetical protein [Streptomyces sp. NBC_01264]|uniref:hypothetical protein n=1 Tax=Streptomyces sp. NBC_01264 TaxID=2903804 RepID=UPI002250B7E7|nr:hypothetical protein [Streptomyces sp. NBC_01264]MCX4775343.1 hypothetical protein [Streptomyces sp. NBC_01264]
MLTPADTGKAPTEPAGPNRADLWSRHKTSGQVLDHPSNGAARLADPRTLTGDTWTAAGRPLATSLGDGNGDGLADLWFTTTYDPQSQRSGDLYFQPATTTGWGTPVEIGNAGWGYIESLS